MVFRLCSFQGSNPRLPAVTTEYTLFRKGDDGGGDTPLPIPNREVKPARADGTAGSPRGRVGRRPFFLLFLVFFSESSRSVHKYHGLSNNRFLTDV